MTKLPFADIIVFEDEDYIIINKPYGISTLEDRARPENILKLAREHQEGLRTCHRLDKETSGILVLAKNDIAYRHMNSLFETRKVNKIYHAVVTGVEPYEYIMLSAPIKILKNGLAKIDKREGKEAHTIFNTLKIFRHHSLVECNPITGRLHQIRVHLSEMGSPIVGDVQYGGAPFFLSQYKKKFNMKKYVEERPLMERVALHAHSIKFVKANNATVLVEAPYPKDFRAMLTQMEKFSF